MFAIGMKYVAVLGNTPLGHHRDHGVRIVLPTIEAVAPDLCI